MEAEAFHTPDGTPVPAVTAAEMSEVDRVAVDEIGLTLRRMIEHAGRSLALEALDRHEGGPVVVLAGGGGNGGGGLVCARHLGNREIPTTVVLDREPEEFLGVPGEQLDILRHIDSVRLRTAPDNSLNPSLVVDALLGYGLEGAPRGTAATLVEWTNTLDSPVFALDVPSGVDATTGDTPGVATSPERTLTLALPKTGLELTGGEVVLADLSIPGEVYERLDVPVTRPFGREFRVSLVQA
jgi:NAD(P)H-hydrate epimerase